MPQSLAKNLIHLIYSTKDREPCLSPEIRAGLFGYKAGILKEWKSQAAVVISSARGSCAHLVLSLEEPRLGEGELGGKEGVVQMDEDSGTEISGLSLASRLWCFLGQPIPC